MVDGFRFSANKRLRFGAGILRELPGLIAEYGERALLITGSSFAGTAPYQDLKDALDDRKVAFVHETWRGEPTPDGVDEIVRAYRKAHPDVVVAVGGGSVLDIGKAVSAMLKHKKPVKTYLEGVGTKKPRGHKVPFIAVPTTAGTGSEATMNAVLSEPGPEGFKKSLRHEAFIPDEAVVDPTLTLNCPPEITAASGMDAFCQLLESWFSTEASPLTDALCWTGLTMFTDAFPDVCGPESSHLAKRGQVAFAAYLSGLTLANAGLGTVHGLAGVLGGRRDIPHGTACATLLEPVVSLTFGRLVENDPLNRALWKGAELGRHIARDPALPDDRARDYLVQTLADWTDQLAIPRLSAYGFVRRDLDGLAAAGGNKNNPWPLSAEDRLQVLIDRL